MKSREPNDTGRPGRPKSDQRTYLAKLYILMGIIAALLVAVLLLFPERVRDTDAPTAEQPAQRDGDGDPVTELPPDAEAPTPPRQPEDDRQPAPPVVENRRREPAEPRPVVGRIAIVIDDVGNDLAELKSFLELPGEITFAVLPQRQFSRQASQMIAEAGREAIMHLPMEPLGTQNPGEGAILVSLSRGEIEEIIERNLATVPGVVGANNHMGSRATADPAVMDAVLSSLGRRGLFFLDSRTSAETVGASTALRLGVPYAERAVFIDNDRVHDAIRTQLRQGMELAAQRGHAVLIGHVTASELADVLLEFYPELIEAGFRLERLSRIVAATGAEYAGAGN